MADPLSTAKNPEFGPAARDHMVAQAIRLYFLLDDVSIFPMPRVIIKDRETASLHSVDIKRAVQVIYLMLKDAGIPS